VAKTGQAAKRNYDKRSKIGTKAALKKSAANAAVVAINLIPTGRAASTVGKFVSRTTATKMVPGESKEVIRKFTQGKKANIVEQAPKRYKEGPKSPVKGTKVTVEKETKGQTPLQYATVTKGAVTRKNTKKAVTIAKTAANTAYAIDKYQESKKKKKDKK
jgi:hypothetical protein